LLNKKDLAPWGERSLTRFHPDYPDGVSRAADNGAAVCLNAARAGSGSSWRVVLGRGCRRFCTW